MLKLWNATTMFQTWPHVALQPVFFLIVIRLGQETQSQTNFGKGNLRISAIPPQANHEAAGLDELHEEPNAEDMVIAETFDVMDLSRRMVLAQAFSDCERCLEEEAVDEEQKGNLQHC